MTRAKKLREVLNVRLDEALARELTRIATTQNRTESDVARTLLGYGIEVVRRIEADAFKRPFSWQEDEDEPHPTILEIDARRRPMTEAEIEAHGLRAYVGHVRDDEDGQDE